MLVVTNLHAKSQEADILKGVSFSLKAGTVTALMGPNGSGKSTLANLLAGHPAYVATSGTVSLDKKDLLEMKPEERAQAGLFLAFQYPASLPGVSVSHFIRQALNAQEKSRGEEITGVAPFIRLLRTHMKTLDIPTSFAERSLNDGFSGGEKKRMEMLQMLVLQPKCIILDEIDSGLDIDAIKVVAAAVNSLRTKERAILVITHYQRLLEHIKPDNILVLQDGQITRTGGPELATDLEREGYGRTS
ncbi:MAG: Fe-S cluster assembly ATPase SufC [bacterium]